MENIKREELISAYLDGELDAIEAARTEQWIAEDPRAKKLFDDLKLMQDAIHQLPRHPLESDLTRGVLDQIVDQSVVSESHQPDPFIAASYCEDSAVTERSLNLATDFSRDSSEFHQAVSANSPATQSPQGVHRRIYLWPAIAVAVALLLMIFSRSDQTEKDAMVVRTDASVNSKMLPPHQAAVESMEISALELGVEAEADKKQITNQRPAGEQLARATQNYQSFNRVAPRKKTAQYKALNRLPTYIFGVAPSLDLARQLEDFTKDDRQIRLIKLGMSEKSESSHHIFELSGDAEAIHKVTESLKNTQGITLASIKMSFREDEDIEKQSATSQRSLHELKEELDPFEIEEAIIQTVPSSIRMIFVVPSS